MILSRRERHVAIGCGAAVVLLFIWFALFGPWIESRQDLAAKLNDAQATVDADNALLLKQVKLETDWKKMQANGLQTDETQAQIMTLTALNQWAPAAGVNLEGVTPDLPKANGPFMVIGFGLRGEGTTRSVALLLWSLENAGIPLRVNDVLIQPRSEGTDNLSFTIHVSSVCVLPPKTGSGGAAGGQS